MLRQYFAQVPKFPLVPPLGKATRYILATVQGFIWTDRGLPSYNCGDSGTITSPRCPLGGCRPSGCRNREGSQLGMYDMSLGASCAFQECLDVPS